MCHISIFFFSKVNLVFHAAAGVKVVSEQSELTTFINIYTSLVF